MDQANMSKWQHDFSLSSTMGYEPIFIGLKWIEMVDILVGEVDRRSPKDGSRAQLALVSRDKGAANPSFKKLHENPSFLTFYHRHRFYP